MSIVTLKKKTNATIQIMSTNKPRFSLNGNYRNQGYVGQNLISRSLPRTPVNGHGGFYGTYIKGPVVMSSVSSTENNNYTKSSVLGNKGMLMTKYRWARRPQPYAVVKPDDGKISHDQGTYIQKLTQDAINCTSSKKSKDEIASTKCINAMTSNNNAIPIITKPETEYSIMSEGLYVKGLDKKCAINDFNEQNVVNYKRTPFFGFN